MGHEVGVQVMPANAFKLSVTAPVTVECDFWVEDDGWIGTAEQFGIIVHAGSFENAKRKMEDALAEYLESLLQRKAAPERKIA
jgi:predicted RNase H-like HicB family nuclease